LPYTKGIGGRNVIRRKGRGRKKGKAEKEERFKGYFPLKF
jgi:hypothetical protein